MGESGSFLAECKMQITEKVEGYIDGRIGEFHPYQDLQQRNPNMRARSRNFRTSGVVLYINHDWFKKNSVKRPFADRVALVHESELARNEPDSQVHHLPRAYDDGLPSSAIRLRM